MQPSNEKNHKLQRTLIAHNADYDMTLIPRELTLPDFENQTKTKTFSSQIP